MNEDEKHVPTEIAELKQENLQLFSRVEILEHRLDQMLERFEQNLELIFNQQETIASLTQTIKIILTKDDKPAAPKRIRKRAKSKPAAPAK